MLDGPAPGVDPQLPPERGLFDQAAESIRDFRRPLGFHQEAIHFMLDDFRQSAPARYDSRQPKKTRLKCCRWKRILRPTWHYTNVHIRVDKSAVRHVIVPLHALCHAQNDRPAFKFSFVDCITLAENMQLRL